MDLENKDGRPPVAKGHSGIAARVKSILLQPKAEWDRIDAEPATIGEIYRNWVVILAAIPPVATLIGSLLFGYTFFGVTYRPPVMAAIAGALVQYVLTLVGVYVLALIIEALAPTFNGTKDRVKAFKVAAYSSTAAWVAGIFGLLPALAIIGLLGALYSLYLLYLGLPRLMKTPADKALPYTAVVIVAAIVVFMVIGALMGPVTAMFGGGPPTVSPANVYATP
jgi:Yip1 domain